MLTFVARRLVGMALVLLVVSFVVFLIFIVVPGGDPAVRIAGRTANDQNIANIRETWGFNDPFYVQYVAMMKKALNGLRPNCCEGQQSELRSQTNQLNVVDQIKDGLPATLSLSVGAAVIWVFFGILVGIIAAVTAGRWSDRLITLVALIGISMPVFWLGIIARYYLAEGGLVTLFPDGEYVPLTENPAQWFWHLLLPWFVLAVLFIGFYGRVMRGNILDTINEDFVRTARAKGLDPRRVMVKHVLRNSLIPIVTLFDFAAVLGGGAILTETVFDLHGVGQYAAQSIRNFDLPPIMGVTLYGAFFIVLFNAIVDFLYAYLDPRIRPT
jgi:peptide/nickel transport system permease protein